MLNKKALGATAAANKLYVEDVFSTYVWAGTGNQLSINNGVDLLNEGGMVWIKNRSSASYSNQVFDTERGFFVSGGQPMGKNLITNNDNAESYLGYGFSAFNSNGFRVGYDDGAGTNVADTNVNGSGNNYTSWSFRKAEKFFDVVTYTGTGSFRSVSHNLGSVPGVMIVKCASTAGEWAVYHRSLSANNYLVLNNTAASDTAGYWGNTTPTSTEFYVGSLGDVNASGRTYVAYLFAHDAGGFGDSGSDSVIKCGSYTTDGSGNADVDLGWEPQFAIIKRTDLTGNWNIVDTMRSWVVGDVNNNSILLANSSAEEATGQTFQHSPTATGIKVRSAGASRTFVYIAIRRGPMKTPEAGTEVFEPFVDRTSIANKTNGTMGPVDMTMQTQVSTPLAGYNWSTFDRLRGANKYLQTDSDPAEGTATSVSFDVNGGVKNATWFSSGGVGYNFKRAPGFFDVVCYTGNGSGTNQTLSHNLGVTPEMIICKSRNNSGDWPVYTPSTGIQYQAYINYNFAPDGPSTQYWGNTSPTSTQFTVGGSSNNTSGYTYVAYLFATLAGVSKVGSYTGTASTLSINCGFTGGARLVLVKRTDTTGDWYVWDSARGIVSGNDPYLRLNSRGSEVTSTDYIDSISSGFELTADGSSTVNVTGGTYIFLAIA